MPKLNYPPRPHQKIIHIQRTTNHSFHKAPPEKARRNFIPLITIIILLSFGVWGIRKYLSYRGQKIAQENYTQGVKDLTDGNFNAASKSLEKSIQSGNDTNDTLLKLGVSKYNQKDYVGAIEAYSKVLEKDPLNATASNGLGNVYRDQKDFDKAQEQYEKAIQLDPHFAPAYANLSIMLLDLNREKEAKEVVQRGLTQIPDSIELKNIGTLFSSE